MPACVTAARLTLTQVVEVRILGGQRWIELGECMRWADVTGSSRNGWTQVPDPSLLHRRLTMFWWTVGPLGVFSCIVLAVLGTVALIRVSPADPGEVDHE